MAEVTALLSAIEKQIEHLEHLKTLLENELHLISTREAEPLIKLVKEKEAVLESIHAQDKTVESLYVTLPEDQQKSEQVVAQLDCAKALVSQCKYRTEINQKAVEQGQLRLEHLRSLLLEIRAKENMTYDKSGKPQARRSGKDITA